MNKTRIGITFAVLALVAVLGFLIVMTRSVDFEANNEIVSTLRKLKQLDAEWNVDVLRSKTGLNNSYDPVVGPLPLIGALANQLQSKSESGWGQNAESSARLQPLPHQHVEESLEGAERVLVRLRHDERATTPTRHYESFVDQALPCLPDRGAAGVEAISSFSDGRRPKACRAAAISSRNRAATCAYSATE